MSVASLSPQGAQTLTLSFDCNNRCPSCLVEGQRNRAPAMPREVFRAHVDRNRQQRRYRRLLLSGAEVTLHPELLECIGYARASGAYERIRIQTNGRRFADRDFAKAVLAAGADEVYVSVRGHTAAVETAVTGELASFDEMKAGLANLAGLDVTVISNTVMVRQNWPHLASIVDFVAGFGVARIEFYNLVPMRRQRVAAAVPLHDLAPAVCQALDRAATLSIEAAVTWFPRCLLGEHERAFEHHLPETVIHGEFWDAFPTFGCFYASVCHWHGPCEGLPHPTIEAHGWAQEMLRPQPRQAATESSPQPVAELDAGALREVTPMTDSPWLRLLRTANGEPILAAKLWLLRSIQTAPGHVRFSFDLRTGHRIDIMLAARDNRVTHAAQTTSFNVTASSPEGQRPDQRLRDLFLFTLLPLLTRNDDGHLRLD